LAGESKVPGKIAFSTQAIMNQSIFSLVCRLVLGRRRLVAIHFQSPAVRIAAGSAALLVRQDKPKAL